MMVAEACELLANFLLEDVRGDPLINADETTVQVLKEPERKATQKSYMWVFRGGMPEKPIVIYQYHETRSSWVPKLFFHEYLGVVQTDGYVSYEPIFLTSGTVSFTWGCWAHARRI